MDIPKKDLSYYRNRLQELICSRFPEKAHDRKFIEERSGWAADSHDCALRAGNDAAQCDYIADYILLEGLHFSKFDAVLQIVSSEFDNMMPDEELRPFAMKMLAVCGPAFDSFELSQGFAGTPEYHALCKELTARITFWIAENGAM